MGSHGGATAAGQIEVLAERGVTEQSVGAPIEATMETVFLGTSDEGIPLFLDRLAHEADGIVLIVDEMGKDISGEGIDPNVVGRDCCSYGTRRDIPCVTRILVRDLTEATRGSALGIGQADFTLKRLVDKIDVEATAINCLTSCCPEAGRVPLTYDNDRQALSAALMTIRPSQPDEIGIVYIKNTLDLRRMMVSQAYAEQLERDPGQVVEAVGKRLEFDLEGMLKSPFAS